MRKLRIGSPYLFQWRPERTDAVPTSATLSILWAAGTQTYSLTVRANDIVTAISTDRKRLTLEFEFSSTGILADLLDGNPLPAHFSNDSYGQIPVMVTRLVSSVNNPGVTPDTGVVELADPLPAATAGGYIKWLTGSATVSSAHIGSSPIRPVKWTVAYTPKIGGETGAARVETGVLAVVRDVFSTGLVDASLSVVAPWLRGAIAPSMPGLGNYIAAGEDLLISLIRPRLPSGTWEDSVAGGQFHRAHALATQISVCDDLAGRGVARNDLRAQLALDLKSELDGCFARLEWVDINGDGLATADEGATRTAQPILSHVTNANIMDFSDDPTTPDTFDRFRVTGSM